MFVVFGVLYGVLYGLVLLYCDVFNVFDKVCECSFCYGCQIGYYDFDLQGMLFGDMGVICVDCGNLFGMLDVVCNVVVVMFVVVLLFECGVILVVFGGDDLILVLCVCVFEVYGLLNVLQFDVYFDFCDEVNGEWYGYLSLIWCICEMLFVRWIVQVGLCGSGSVCLSDVEDVLCLGNVFVLVDVVYDEGIEVVMWYFVDDVLWFVIVDIDGFDLSIVLGVVVLMLGGLMFYQMCGVLWYLCVNMCFVGIDVVEYYLVFDVCEMIVLMIVWLLINVIGIIVCCIVW